MSPNDENHSNAGSQVNRIPGVTLDDADFIHTAYNSYHPVTGEGHTFDMSKDLDLEILKALIQDGIDSGPATVFDLEKFLEEMRSKSKDITSA